MADEYSILLKSLNVAVGEVQARKILEQFKAVAIENHLDCSRRLLHDFLRVAELELNLHHLRDNEELSTICHLVKCAENGDKYAFDFLKRMIQTE